MRTLIIAGLATLAAACAPTARQSFGPLLVQAKDAGVPVLVYAYGVPGRIAVAGNKSAVPVYIQFVVTGERPIQSIRFTLLGYTPRGVAVRSRGGLRTAVILIGPGPFDPEKNYEVNTFHTDPAGFPGDSVACVELASMQIEFADGQTRDYDADGLESLLLPSLRHGCGDQGPPVNRVNGHG